MVFHMASCVFPKFRLWFTEVSLVSAHWKLSLNRVPQLFKCNVAASLLEQYYITLCN